MERRVAELIDIARTSSSARPGLREPALPGNAWEHYEPALAGFQRTYAATRSLGSLISDVLSGKRMESHARLAPILDTLQADFARMIRASACGDGRFRWDWGGIRPDNSPEPAFLQAHLFASAAIVEARRRVESGNAAEAMELLLAFMAFGRDLGDNASLIDLVVGMAIIKTAGDELQAMVLERKFDQNLLLALERSLETLDLDFPRYGPALRHEQIAYGNLFLSGGTLKESPVVDGPDPETIRAGWRHAFSMRALQADAFFRFDEWCGRLSGVEALTFPELQAIRAEIAQESKSSPNPWAVTLGRLIPGLNAVREYQARLRLLRAATLYRAKGEMPVLSDPFGTVLKSDEAGGSHRMWSLGRDGIDDGGAPDKDLVLTLDP